MKHCKVFVGLDYHEDVIQVCVLSVNGEVLGERRVLNDHQRMAAFVERFGKQAHVAVDVCTGSAALADVLVNEVG